MGHSRKKKTVNTKKKGGVGVKRLYTDLWFSQWLSGKESPCQCRRDTGSIADGEDPTCHGASKPVCHNYWTCALEPGSCNCWAHVPQLRKPTHPRASTPQEKPPQWEARAPQLESSPHSPQLEKSLCSNDDSAQPKIKINFKILYTHLIRRHLGERVNDLGEKMNGPSEEYTIQ